MKGLRESALYQVIWQTRRLFQRLAATGDALHADVGLNASQRALLEFLEGREPQTVPEIARERGVSRQHVQILVNQLLGLGLVRTQENPAHRRSVLVERTEEGREVFKSVRRREAVGLTEMAAHFDRSDLETTARTLAALARYLQSAEWAGVMKQLKGGRQT
jgi:DNA-binding MarR family transcriptional regulator